MVKTALAGTELAMGRKVLEALDTANLSISVAMWLYPEEHEDWRFVLASHILDAASLEDDRSLYPGAAEAIRKDKIRGTDAPGASDDRRPVP